MSSSGICDDLPVAVLCVARNSIYKQFSGVDCYDIDRDVRTFTGNVPVAHPPCRAWSAYCAHQAKPEPGEKELGPLCVEWLKVCGGVLEHPAHSRLWDYCNLPKPGAAAKNGLWAIAVKQAWWGDNRTKSTWLLFSGVNSVSVPMRPHDPDGDRRRWQVLSKNQRAATVPAFAKWLLDTARHAQVAGDYTTGYTTKRLAMANNGQKRHKPSTPCGGIGR